MTTYTVQGPSGKSYTIEGPVGASADQLGQVILSQGHEALASSQAHRQQIYTAIRNADAAGDSDSVRKLGEYLQTLPPDPAEVAHQKALNDTAAWQKTVDPTYDMGTGARLMAGIGRGYASVGRGLGQLVGLTSQDDVNAAKSSDAPLLATRAGKVGNVVGTMAATAPAMFIPGANTYAGAAAIGGVTGALTTEGDAHDRLEGAAGGIAGGILGKGAGDVIGSGVKAIRTGVASRVAANAAANAPRTAAAQAAQDAGYVITPSMSGNPGIIGGTAEAIGGKIKTQQAASVANQKVTNALAAKELGLPADQPITLDALDALRKDAGGAYADVAKLGELDARGAKLPASTGVTTSYDKLTLAPKTTVDAQDLVQAWKQSNADATSYFRQYARDANPETLAKARAAASDASTIDDFMTKAVTQQESRTPAELMADLAKGKLSSQDFIAKALNNEMVQSGAKPSAAQAIQDARVQIAKSYSVENALNPATGDVAATKLAQQLAKGKKLSGGLEQAGQFAQAFPKAAQAGVDVPAYSPLDAYSIASGAGGGNWLQTLASLSRAPARSVALSGPVQRRLTDYEVNSLLNGGADLLGNPRVNALQQLLGTSIGIQAPQQNALQR